MYIYKYGGYRMKLSVVIPCYNEEETVQPLFDELCEVFDSRNIEFDVVFVNDGSSDSTAKKIERIAADTDRRVKAVFFSRNFGKESAIYAGLQQADGDYTAIMDGDMQHPPQIVADMVDYLDANPDIDSVAAVQNQRIEGCVLSFFKRSFYKIINSTASVEFVSGASDFRVCRRPMIDAILSISEYYRFSKGIFSYVGFNTHYMPYIARERGGGKTKWSFAKLFRYAIDGIIGYTTAPLKFLTVTGTLLSVASFIYLAFIVIKRIIYGDPVAGFATLASLVLLLGGIQLLGLGIIGEYVGRNYVETKRRPIYIAKKIIDNSKKKDNDVNEQ